MSLWKQKIDWSNLPYRDLTIWWNVSVPFKWNLNKCLENRAQKTGHRKQGTEKNDRTSANIRGKNQKSRTHNISKSPQKTNVGKNIFELRQLYNLIKRNKGRSGLKNRPTLLDVQGLREGKGLNAHVLYFCRDTP